MANIPIELRMPDHYADLQKLRVLCVVLAKRLGGTVEISLQEILEADTQALSIDTHLAGATVRTSPRLSTIVDTLEPRA